MCTELYVDKLLVYSNCISSPAPGVPSTVPSTVPSPVPSPVPSTVPSSVPSPYTESSSPSAIPSPVMDAIVDGYSLTTPSIIATTKTIMTPSSSNSSNMTDPFGESVPDFIENHGLATVIIVITATVLPTLLMCILVWKKRPKRCKKPNKVQPTNMKKNKPCCLCCSEEPKIIKQEQSTSTGTYLITLPPTPRDTE